MQWRNLVSFGSKIQVWHLHGVSRCQLEDQILNFRFQGLKWDETMKAVSTKRGGIIFLRFPGNSATVERPVMPSAVHLSQKVY